MNVVEIRYYEYVPDPIYCMIVYVNGAGDLFRVDTLQAWTPTADHKLSNTITDPELIAEIVTRIG